VIVLIVSGVPSAASVRVEPVRGDRTRRWRRPILEADAQRGQNLPLPIDLGLRVGRMARHVDSVRMPSQKHPS
jgi:hypothetical protein